ncbi:hypothetical protein, partial [Gordonibacter urolithinfaciens]|uniref:hypothetical protein n=1 Tax=Gordonibacter urolithinfaciens TaxID=1335613 RepID=UPI001F4DBA8F
MLEFDAAVKAVAERHDGLYMRYSDDFIFVVPTEEGFEEGRDEFSRLAGTMPSLKIHPRKTHSFRMVDGGVYLLDSEDEPKCAIDYLGFSFDGTSVRLRQRTIGRFYKRMYRRVGRLYKWKFRPAKKRVDSLYGSAAARLDRLDGVAEPPPAARDRIVHHPTLLAEALEPFVPVP